MARLFLLLSVLFLFPVVANAQLLSPQPEHLKRVRGYYCVFSAGDWQASRRLGAQYQTLQGVIDALIAQLAVETDRRARRALARQIQRVLNSQRQSQRRCNRLAPPEGSTLAVASLTQLPALSGLVGTGETQLSTSAVTGTPPTVLELMVGSDNAFWRPGVLQNLATGAPTQDDCQEFFGSTVDGESAGLGACYTSLDMTDSAENLLRSGTSLCYMQKAPTAANLAGGAVSLLSGAFPNNDVTELFHAPAGSTPRVVQVRATNPEGPGEEIIFIRVNGAATNAAQGLQYGATLWFCQPGSDAVGEYEQFQVTLDGVFSSVQVGRRDGNHSSVATAFLRRNEAGAVVFDNTREKRLDINYISQDETSRFKSSLTFNGSTVRNKIYNSDPVWTRKAYAIADISGVAGGMRFLGGAYRDATLFGSNPGGTESFSEYRDSFYAAAPGHAYGAEVRSMDLASDAFYASPASISGDYDSYSCSAVPNIVVAMSPGSPAFASTRAQCEGERLEDINYCNTTTISMALGNHQTLCPGL